MLNSHRDFRRDNKANAVIQGTIMAKINKSSLDKIKAIVNIKSTVGLTGDKKKELDDAIEVAFQSSTEMTSRYMTCQREMNVSHCESYASQQFGIMKRATLLKDNIMQEQGISNYIITKNMVAMMETVFGDGVQSGKYDYGNHSFASFCYTTNILCLFIFPLTINEFQTTVTYLATAHHLLIATPIL